MNINNKNLCGSCFSEVNENQAVCPVCGYKEGDETIYPAALPYGTVLLGRYIIGKALGKGGFGVTYLAYDSNDGKKAAVKEYLPDTLIHRNTGDTFVSTFQGDKEEAFKKGAERFYEEAQTVSRFNGNPGIVGVYEFFYENNTAYFVMEYLEGVDLKAHLVKNGGTLTEKQVLDIIIPLIDSLIVVHSVGVLHRDISPDNIYMTNDGKIKLLDFGAARQVLGEASKSLSVVLKQGFAPIEQYQTRGKQGQWTDVYALGATMFFCLTGRVPDAPMDRLEEDNLVMPENISVEFKEILQKMTAVRAVHRYQNMTELKQDIQARGLLAGEMCPEENEGEKKSDNAVNNNEKVIPEEDVHLKQNKFISFIKKYKMVSAVIAVCFVAILTTIVIFAVNGGGSVFTGAKEINTPQSKKSVAGIWTADVSESGTSMNYELAINENEEFYLLMYAGGVVESFFVAKGRYEIHGTSLKLITSQAADYNNDDDDFNLYDVKGWPPDECSVGTKSIAMPDEDGEVIFSKGEPSGLWGFSHEIPEFQDSSGIISSTDGDTSNSSKPPAQSSKLPVSSTPPTQSSKPPTSSTPPAQSSKLPVSSTAPVQSSKLPASSTPPAQSSKPPASAVTQVTNRRYTYADPYMQGASGLYTGDWKDGKPNGKGTFVFDKKYSDMGFPAKYTGDWVNGNKHGQGTATWSDGSAYTGAFVNNKKHGRGKMTDKNGKVIHDGNWVNDEPDKAAETPVNWVYSNDATGIYKTKEDGTGKTKLCSDPVPDKIIVSGDWIYYSSPNSDWFYQLYKIKTNGTGRTLICADDCLEIALSGNWIFYVNGMNGGLYKVRTDGTGRTHTGSDVRLYSFYVSGDWVFYTDSDGIQYKIKNDGTGNQRIN